MCKKIMIRQNKWVEVEEGLTQLRPFESEAMPTLTHGICPECYDIVMAELNDFGPPNT